jgi:hypothetical protein
MIQKLARRFRKSTHHVPYFTLTLRSYQNSGAIKRSRSQPSPCIRIDTSSRFSTYMHHFRIKEEPSRAYRGLQVSRACRSRSSTCLRVEDETLPDIWSFGTVFPQHLPPPAALPAPRRIDSVTAAHINCQQKILSDASQPRVAGGSAAQV